MKPNVQVVLPEGKPGQVLVHEFVISELSFGAFHVGDILCIRQTNYRVVRREINIDVHAADIQRLFLYLFVEKV